MREVVPSVLAGERVDRVVSLLTGLARSKVAALVAEGRVLVDGTPASRAQRVEEGQQVELSDEFVPEEGSEVIKPLEPDPAIDVRVVHEDEWLVVIDKPAGLVVHPGAG